MRLALIAASSALLIASATAASAGGFKYGSIGGNVGYWSYGDAAAASDVIVDAGKGGKCRKCGNAGGGSAATESYGTLDTYANKYSAGGAASSGTYATFQGNGHIQAGSSALIGAGSGAGFGFKAGGTYITKGAPTGGKKSLR